MVRLVVFVLGGAHEPAEFRFGERFDRRASRPCREGEISGLVGARRLVSAQVGPRKATGSWPEHISIQRPG